MANSEKTCFARIKNRNLALRIHCLLENTLQLGIRFNPKKEGKKVSAIFEGQKKVVKYCMGCLAASGARRPPTHLWIMLYTVYPIFSYILQIPSLFWNTWREKKDICSLAPKVWHSHREWDGLYCTFLILTHFCFVEQKNKNSQRFELVKETITSNQEGVTVSELDWNSATEQIH